MIKDTASALLFWVISFSSAAGQTIQLESQEPPVLSEANAIVQETCLASIAGFPDETATIRYQFFKLIHAMTADATPDFLAALDHFGDGQINPALPIPEAIDGLANPVTRQAMPSLTVAQFSHLFNFSNLCGGFIDGQLESLIAFDEALSHSEFNEVISEDALFLRQLLLDALFRLDADKDPIHGPAVQKEAVQLVRTRDKIEYAAFDASVEELESFYMGDLDGRLAKINDVINGEMDRETLDASVEMAKDMSKESRNANRVNVWRILCPWGCQVTF